MGLAPWKPLVTLSLFKGDIGVSQPMCSLSALKNEVQQMCLCSKAQMFWAGSFGVSSRWRGSWQHASEPVPWLQSCRRAVHGAPSSPGSGGTVGTWLGGPGLQLQQGLAGLLFHLLHQEAACCFSVPSFYCATLWGCTVLISKQSSLTGHIVIGHP